MRPRRRALILFAACCVVAGATLFLPWDLSFDPWAWVLWGRELTSPIPLSTSPYPSWKPLPVFFTTVFSVAGGAAPALWLVVVRAGALGSLVLAYRLGTRLAGRGAGLIAVAGVVLMPEWLRHFAGGASEPLLVALVLAMVDRHLDGHRNQALALGVGAALLRPEAWPFLGLYCIVWAWRRPLRLAVVAALGAAVAALWFVPEWIAAADPFYGSRLAKSSAEAHQTQALPHPALTALQRCLSLAPLPLGLAALGELAFAARTRARVELVLAAGALVWVAIVVAMTAGGYAGLGRFALPAGAITCVLGAAGLVRLRDLIPGRGGKLALGAALLVCLPFVVYRAEHFGDDARVAVQNDKLEDGLGALVASLGGPPHVLACGRVTTDGLFRPALAWRLGVPIHRLADAHRPLLVFRVHKRKLIGYEGHPFRLGRVAPAGASRIIAHGNGWDVLMTRRPSRCRSLPAVASRS